MNTATLQSLGVIVAIFTGLIGVFYLQRSSVRENARVQQAKITEAVAAGVKPVQDALDAANRAIERKDARIDQLEDELRRGRT
jgi:hypothetical protein